MLFVKQEIYDGVTISIEITSENVYVNCLGCSRELHVDLNSDNDDLRAEDTLCGSCLQRIIAEKKRRKHGRKNKYKECVL